MLFENEMHFIRQNLWLKLAYKTEDFINCHGN